MPIKFSTLDGGATRYIRPRFGTHSPRIHHLPEAASCNFCAGEPVVLSTESVTQIATRPSSGAVSSSLASGDLILGVALDDATGTTGNIVRVIEACDVEILVRVYNATSTNAELQDVVMGDLAELFRYYDGNRVWPMISDAANGTDGINKVVIAEKYSENRTGKPGSQSATDTYAMVWARFRPTLTVNGR